MTSRLDTSAGDRRRTIAYHREFWPGMVGYVVLLAAALAWGGLDGTSPWRFVWAVLPVLPTLLVVRAGIRHLRRSDEYQRRIALQGLASGFALAMVASLVLGMLGIAGLALPASGWIVYSVGMVGWAVASGIAARR